MYGYTVAAAYAAIHVYNQVVLYTKISILYVSGVAATDNIAPLQIFQDFVITTTCLYTSCPI